MSWWHAITGLFRPAKELIEVFKPNAEMAAARGHEETMALSEQDMASLQQFAAEFHSRERRTWWDSLVDGLNRLPRPLITLGVLGLFVLAPLDPLRFLEIARAYQLMPDGFWALLSIIIAFYFGGRMQLTRQKMAIPGDTLEAAKDIVSARKALREMAAEDEPAADDEPTAAAPKAAPGPAPMPAFQRLAEAMPPSSSGNRVVEAWLLLRRKQQPETATS
jgi:hypothetical protein